MRCHTEARSGSKPLLHRFDKEDPIPLDSPLLAFIQATQRNKRNERRHLVEYILQQHKFDSGCSNMAKQLLVFYLLGWEENQYLCNVGGQTFIIKTCVSVCLIMHILCCFRFNIKNALKKNEDKTNFSAKLIELKVK